MEIITSVQNSLVKQARSLKEKKFRIETGLYLAEGINLLKDIPEGAEVQYVLMLPEMEEEIAEMLARTHAKVYYVGEGVMKALSDTLSPHGAVAVVKKPHNDFHPPKGNAILLDGISDPGNLGTILRTSAAADFTDVYLYKCTDAYAPKAVRASLGGIFRVNLCEVNEAEIKLLLDLTEGIALDMAGEDIFEGEIPGGKLTVCVGSEAHGLSEEVLAGCKHFRSIPMANGVESLNAAVAAGIAMYKFR
jgi:TrmH family RNA methyltransferase